MEPAKRRKIELDPKGDGGDTAGDKDAAESTAETDEKAHAPDKSEEEKAPAATEPTEQLPPNSELMDCKCPSFISVCLT